MSSEGSQTGAIGGAPDITLVDVWSDRVHIEPNEEITFSADVHSNIDYTTEETVRWFLGDTLITVKSDDISGGETHTFRSWAQSWSDVTDLVDPGVYTLTGVLEKSDVVEESQTVQWTDSNGDPITIDVTDSDGNMPGQADINITDVERSPLSPIAGETMDIDITAENFGDESGTESYLLDIGLAGEAMSTVANIDFSLSAGESLTKTATVQIPEDWAGEEAAFSIGPETRNFDVALPEAEVSLSDFSVSSSENMISVSTTWSNEIDYDVSMAHLMDVTDESGTVVASDTEAITIGPSGSETVEASIETDVPAGDREDFEVCVNSENETTY